MRHTGFPGNAAPPHVRLETREPFHGGPGVWHGMPHGPQMASRELDAADLAAREPFHLPSWLHFGHHQEETQPQAVSRRSLSEEKIQAREAFHGGGGYGGPPSLHINHGPQSMMARAVDLSQADLEARGPVRVLKWNPALMIGREVEEVDIAAREPHMHGPGGRASRGRGPQVSPQRREDTFLEARDFDTLNAREQPFFPLQSKAA